MYSRRKKEEGRRKKEEGRRKKEEPIPVNFPRIFFSPRRRTKVCIAANYIRPDLLKNP
ncbi:MULTISPECIES: hypothetical protein [unclassified Microcoleus]|uniref:hypothetical protein n=1 Tax=unclassified Microcoleus TaxID=2642155 RepID=UPI002FD5360A